MSDPTKHQNHFQTRATKLIASRHVSSTIQVRDEDLQRLMSLGAKITFDNRINQLECGLDIEHPSDIERQSIIQSFEFSWKTLKANFG